MQVEDSTYVEGNNYYSTTMVVIESMYSFFVDIILPTFDGVFPYNT